MDTKLGTYYDNFINEGDSVVRTTKQKVEFLKGLYLDKNENK